MIGMLYYTVGLLLCAAIFYGWYWLSGAILMYLRRSYPEQARDLPASLFAGEGWNSTESKLIRAILSNHSIYYYDARVRQYRLLLILYFIASVVLGAGYALYPLFVR
jgi:hypothetical protein